MEAKEVNDNDGEENHEDNEHMANCQNKTHVISTTNMYKRQNTPQLADQTEVMTLCI